MNDHHKDPDQLEREVDQARDQVGRTVNALSEKLSPGELLDQAMGMVSEHGGEFASNLGQQVKNNPLALLMTGIGVTWLAAGKNTAPNKARNTTHGAYTGTASGSDSNSSAARNSSSAIKQKASDAGDKLQEVGDKLKDAKDSGMDSLRSGKERAAHTVEEVREQLQTVFEDQPLIVGGLGIALGAALGALLPPSDEEDRMLGDVSDELTTKAANKAEEQYDQVRDKAKDVASTVKKEVKERNREPGSAGS